MSKNGVIGKEGDLPFKIPGDLKRFKELTLNHAVLMGRKTWDSLPEKFRPLSDRFNIVLTRDEEVKYPDGVCIDSNIEDAIGRAKWAGYSELYIIGGGEIYAQTIDLVHEVRMTIWNEEIEGDTFYPDMPYGGWYEIYEEDKGTHIYKDFARSYSDGF